MSILKTKLYLFIYAFIGTLCLTSCSFNLGFEPTILYKFSAELKYARDNNVMQKEPEIHLFNNYENIGKRIFFLSVYQQRKAFAFRYDFKS